MTAPMTTAERLEAGLKAFAQAIYHLEEINKDVPSCDWLSDEWHSKPTELEKLRAAYADLQAALTATALPAIPEELRELSAKATKGTWYQSGSPWFQSGSVILAGSPDPHVGATVADTEAWDSARDEHNENDPATPLADADDDAAFIVASVNFIRSLIAAQPLPPEDVSKKMCEALTDLLAACEAADPEQAIFPQQMQKARRAISAHEAAQKGR